MQFDVTFKTDFEELALIKDNGMGEASLDAVDDIMDEFPQYRNLPIKEIYISDACPLRGDIHSFELTEAQARETGLFGGKKDVNVTVDEGAFDVFVHRSVKELFYSNTIKYEFSWNFSDWQKAKSWFSKRIITPGELKGINVKFAVVDQDIYDAWKEAGFPLKWR